MRVLVACEFSGRVRDAFLEMGHDAWSCDLQPSWSREGRHVTGDVRPLLREPWDLVIAHPPCTYLTKLGAPHNARNPRRRERMGPAAEFFRRCLDSNAPRVCVENPVMLREATALVGPPTQTIQPYWFGDHESKATCLWLKNLPPLRPTEVVRPVYQNNLRHSTGSRLEKARRRSVTYWGVARAMAEQWGTLPTRPCPFSV